MDIGEFHNRLDEARWAIDAAEDFMERAEAEACAELAAAQARLNRLEAALAAVQEGRTGDGP
jgi:hypothetical protein